MNSMTGFGRVEAAQGDHIYTIELKSVNHRYLDMRFRLPSHLSSLELTLSERLRKDLSRGSLEIGIRTRPKTEAGSVTGHARFAVDETALKSLNECMVRLKKEFPEMPALTLDGLASLPRVLVTVDEPLDLEKISKEVLTVFEDALKALKQTRAREGAQLKTILEASIQKLRGEVSTIEKLAASHPKLVEEKLKNRIAGWQIPQVDAQRLELEIAFYADRADVHEEIQRLKSHCDSFLATLSQTGSVGRQLDFLTQELHREVNTIASKSDSLEMTQAAIGAKSWIEKLREQVQNVE